MRAPCESPALCEWAFGPRPFSPTCPLILRKARIHLIAPGKNPALHTPNLPEPGLFHQIHSLSAPHAALTMHHKLIVQIELIQMLRQLTQRNQSRTRNPADLELM